MKKIKALLVLAALIWIPVVVTMAQNVADVIYYNAKIATLDAAGTTAAAVAIKDGKFLKTGSVDEIKKLAGPATKMVDLGGSTVVPGLIDAHCHPMEAAMMKSSWVDCRFPETPSVKEALEHIRAWVKKTPKGDWVYVACVSASENKFAEKRLPSKAELDAASPDNPLVLANGTHMAVANSAALKALGITNGTKKLPKGGSVILDKDGVPTGTITDGMADIPMSNSLEQLKQYYTKDMQEFWNEHGFTSFLAITPAAALPVLQGLAAAKFQPTIRYTTSIWTSANGGDMPEDLSKFKMPASADPAFYRFGGIKVWIDGENDCRTGYMYGAYKGHFDTDPTGDKGSLVTPEPIDLKIANIAAKNGVMVMLHGSGDKAMDIGLTTYEELVKTGKQGKIFRLEHFGMFQMSDKQLARAKALYAKGLRISVQPTWLLDLVKADYENMGARRTETGFRFRSMIDAGLEPAAGSDVTGIYLDNVNPFLAIYASVTRRSDDGLFEQQKEAVTVTEALKMWTVWAAKSIGEFDVKGSIEPGKYGDMTVLSSDIFTIPSDSLRNVVPLKTIVGGKVVYDRKKAMSFNLPDGQSIYDPPVPLPAGKHGDLIWATEIQTAIPGARAWKILYRSTDIHDVPCAVSGMIIAPVGKTPAGGRPVVTWAHGTAGINRDCAPSMIDNPAKEASFYMFPNSPDRIDAGIPALGKMIAAGYVVAATDYQGLGAPGFHQYLIGPTAARNVLDAVLATRQFPEAGAGKQAVALGWSQGGQASVWAGQLADYLTDSVVLLGAAALAPVNALEQSKIEAQVIASGKALPPMTTSETIMAQYAMAGTFPELQISDVLTPFGVEFIKESSKYQCSKQMGQSLAYMQGWKGTATRTDPQNQDKWFKRIEQMALGSVPAKVPIAVYQGDDDPTIFPAASEAYVKAASAAGTKIIYRHYAGADHLRVPAAAEADFLSWIADRFAGKP